MKFGKNQIIYISATLLFIIYLFSADYIFNVLLKTEQEAKLSDISLPHETKGLSFHIDEARQVKLKWKDALFVRGWIFRGEVYEESRNVYLVLKSDDNTLIFDIEEDTISRRDVTDHFDMDIDIHGHGFELTLITYFLKEDLYQIGFVIKDEVGKHYLNSNQELFKFNNIWHVR